MDFKLRHGEARRDSQSTIANNNYLSWILNPRSMVLEAAQATTTDNASYKFVQRVENPKIATHKPFLAAWKAGERWSPALSSFQMMDGA